MALSGSSGCTESWERRVALGTGCGAWEYKFNR